MLKQAEVDTLLTKVEAMYAPDAKEKFPDLEVEKVRAVGEVKVVFDQLAARDFEPDLDIDALAIRIQNLMNTIIAASSKSAG